MEQNNTKSIRKKVFKILKTTNFKTTNLKAKNQKIRLKGGETLQWKKF